jgi:hypothetical protein
MPRQTPSDQGYQDNTGWSDRSSQPPWNGSSADADHAQLYTGQPLAAAVPPPPPLHAPQSPVHAPQYAVPAPPLAVPTAPLAVPATPPAEAPRMPMSRRNILRGVAGVGALGAAAAVGAGAAIKLDKPGELKPKGKPVAMAPMAPSAMAGPLVVYIADTTNGVLDVFGGTGETQIRNPALVNQLLANLKLA